MKRFSPPRSHAPQMYGEKLVDQPSLSVSLVSVACVNCRSIASFPIVNPLTKLMFRFYKVNVSVRILHHHGSTFDLRVKRFMAGERFLSNGRAQSSGVKRRSARLRLIHERSLPTCQDFQKASQHEHLKYPSLQPALAAGTCMMSERVTLDCCLKPGHSELLLADFCYMQRP
jgi:hypothetical protein